MFVVIQITMATSRTTKVAQVTDQEKQLQDQISKKALSKKGFSRQQKLERDAEDTMFVWF